MVRANSVDGSEAQFFRELLRKYGHWLRALANSLLDDDFSSDATDTVQEAIAETVVKASSREVRDLSCWDISRLTSSELARAVEMARAYLRKTVVQICYGKNKKKRPRLTEDAGHGASGREADPLDAMIGAETQSKIWEALTDLTLEDQQVLILSFFEDLSYKEIAGALDIPLGTVKSRIHRACKHAKETKAFREVYAMVHQDSSSTGR